MYANNGLLLAGSENQGSGRCYLRFFVQSAGIWGLTQWWERSVMSPKPYPCSYHGYTLVKAVRVGVVWTPVGLLSGLQVVREWLSLQKTAFRPDFSMAKFTSTQ